MAPPVFDTAFRARLAELLAWRRDVRRFRDEALPPGTLERLLALAELAPSSPSSPHPPPPPLCWY